MLSFDKSKKNAFFYKISIYIFINDVKTMWVIVFSGDQPRTRFLGQ